MSKHDSTLADGCNELGTGGGVEEGSSKSFFQTSTHASCEPKSNAPIFLGSNNPLNSVRICENNSPISSLSTNAL